MTVPRIDLPADLAEAGADGVGRSLLRDALDAPSVVPGLVATAGMANRWAVVRVTKVDDAGQVHFIQLEADDPAAQAVLADARAAADPL